MGNMRFKAGDHVKIKSNDFFNKNKGKLPFYVDSMALCFSNEIVTIKSHGRHPDTYRILEDEGDFLWSDEMFEGLVEEETKPKYEDEVNGEYHSTTKYLVRPSGYQFVDENGNIINAMKIVLEKKKKEYPKTYEECCNILHAKRYHGSLLEALQKLLICRDAYWKIAGEEMGLGKPWKPTNGNGEKVYSIVRCCGTIKKNPICDFSNCHILEFPTEEMRDAFKENFDKDLEICKELL